MPRRIDIAVNADRGSLNLTVNSEAGQSRTLTLSTIEVSQLLQDLGDARMNMEPARQPKPDPTDRFQGTMNSPSQVFPGSKNDAFLLLLLDIRYGLLGYEFQIEKWHALVKQVSDFLGEPSSRN